MVIEIVRHIHIIIPHLLKYRIDVLCQEIKRGFPLKSDSGTPDVLSMAVVLRKRVCCDKQGKQFSNEKTVSKCFSVNMNVFGSVGGL